MKRVFSIVFLVLLGVLLVACNNNTDEFDFERGYIVVGLEADYPPFNWMETEANDYNHPIHGTNNFVAGYDVDVAIAIAAELNLELRIVALDWLALIPALQSNEIDLIIAGMSPTDERKQQINFTDGYFTVRHVVVVHKDNALANATELSDLEGTKGVGQIGTVYANIVDFTAERFGAIALPVMDTTTLITNALQNGEADFTVVEKPVAQSMIAASQNLRIVLESSENIFELSDADRLLSIGFRKTNPNLGDHVNTALSNITNAMRDEWMNLAIVRSGE